MNKELVLAAERVLVKASITNIGRLLDVVSDAKQYVTPAEIFKHKVVITEDIKLLTYRFETENEYMLRMDHQRVLEAAWLATKMVDNQSANHDAEFQLYLQLKNKYEQIQN